MYIYTVYTYIYIYIYMCIYIYLYLYTRVCACVCMYSYMFNKFKGCWAFLGSLWHVLFLACSEHSVVLSVVLFVGNHQRPASAITTSQPSGTGHKATPSVLHQQSKQP